MQDWIAYALVDLVEYGIGKLLTQPDPVKCSFCHYREADLLTDCCETPMCEVCTSGAVKRRFLRRSFFFSCPFCKQRVKLEIPDFGGHTFGAKDICTRCGASRGAAEAMGAQCKA
jgi:hypothetical protein